MFDLIRQLDRWHTLLSSIPGISLSAGRWRKWFDGRFLQFAKEIIRWKHSTIDALPANTQKEWVASNAEAFMKLHEAEGTVTAR